MEALERVHLTCPRKNTGCFQEVVAFEMNLEHMFTKNGALSCRGEARDF
jgi:hypothetical protein